MTAKQILDAFSETLMQDERILNPRERELLTSLLQNSRAVSTGDPQTQTAVDAAITRAVGETVAQRAFALLGGNIVERILARSEVTAELENTTPAKVQLKAPQPPGAKEPERPERSAPQPPGSKPPAPGSAPQPPGVSQSASHGQLRPLSVPVQQGGARHSHADSGYGVGVLDAPATVRAQSVVLDEFLSPSELDELAAYTLLHEAEFQNSEVISPSGEPGAIDYSHRRSRVLMDLGQHQEIVLQRIRGVLPAVLDKLEIDEFPITQVEAQITASNEGDFFGAHSDDSQETIASRRITFVYFFHHEPSQFEGGELRLYDRRDSEPHVSAGSYQTIVPQQNQIVFFPCSVLHEITPVRCRSRAFADSRFTLNGWLHQ
jgi:Rps23 Pro-64 3,4-dihydroxylase Tpa1-like proline 4-hydroxylase